MSQTDSTPVVMMDVVIRKQHISDKVVETLSTQSGDTQNRHKNIYKNAVDAQKFLRNPSKLIRLHLFLR